MKSGNGMCGGGYACVRGMRLFKVRVVQRSERLEIGDEPRGKARLEA